MGAGQGAKQHPRIAFESKQELEDFKRELDAKSIQLERSNAARAASDADKAELKQKIADL